jgi:hypothetical protein
VKGIGDKDLSDEELEVLFTSESEDLADADTIVRWFTATYRSECSDCSETISPDDRAGYIDDDTEASCQECCDQALL